MLFFRVAAPLLLTSSLLLSQVNQPPHAYKIYAGSTHAHTTYTWSHGDQFAKNNCAGILVYGPTPKSPGAFSWSDGYVKSATGANAIVKPDWEKYQACHGSISNWPRLMASIST
jgi:hypothetical protein